MKAYQILGGAYHGDIYCYGCLDEPARCSEECHPVFAIDEWFDVG
jgi:hypothetical protein